MLCTDPRVSSGSTGVGGLRAQWEALRQPGFMTSRLHPRGDFFSPAISGFCVFQLKQRNKEPGTRENHRGKPGHSEEAW